MKEFMEMDPAFAARDARRRAGLPVEIVRTKRLILRETTVEDVPELYRICHEPEVERYVQLMPFSLEEETALMRAYIRHVYPFYDFGLWTVLERESGRVAGRVGLMPPEFLEEGVEFGYLIAPEFQGRGYALECGRAAMAYAREMLNLQELHLFCHGDNAPSLRTARALGFREAGTLRRDGEELWHFVAALEILCLETSAY